MKTILLVDDVRLFLEMQKEFLRSSQVEVVTAANGIDALRAVSRKRPDLIFMDLEMPEMNGADCCRTLKSDPVSAPIPVVMITAKGDEASQSCCRAAGCDDFLTKPLERERFLSTAGRFIRGIELRTERKTVRLPCRVQALAADGRGTIEDLSVGGALVSGEVTVAVGRIIKLAFALPDGTELECQGKIVWSSGAPVGGRYLFGVSFMLPAEEVKQALARYLKGLPAA